MKAGYDKSLWFDLARLGITHATAFHVELSENDGTADGCFQGGIEVLALVLCDACRMPIPACVSYGRVKPQ